jgi:4-amino-4-deoxy-L-arabinose transferase-like glycosyltransferase
MNFEPLMEHQKYPIPACSDLSIQPIVDPKIATGLIQDKRWQWWLLVLFTGVLALGFRYYYVTQTQVFQPVNQANVRADAVEYYNCARNLVRHGVFSKSREGTTLTSDSFRDPGYPVFEAGWMKVFGQWDSWYAAMLLSQALLGALTVVLTLALARRWMPLRWLAAAGVLMAVWPHSVAMSSYLLSETLFGFLAALGLLLLHVALERRRAGWAALSGIGFSLAALTNAVLLPFAPLLALYLLIRKRASLALCASLAVAALAVVAPWILRNSLLPASSASSSGRALINLVQGSWPSMHSAYQAAMKQDPEGIVVMAAIEHEFEAIQKSPAAGLALIGHRMASRPGHYLWWYLSKPALLWDWNIRMGQGDVYVYPTRNSPFKTNVAYHVVAALCRALNPWLFALAIAGCLLALLPGQRTPPDRAAAALVLMFVTLVYSILQAEPRYSVPFRGLEIAVATFATYRINQAVKHVRQLGNAHSTAA